MISLLSLDQTFSSLESAKALQKSSIPYLVSMFYYCFTSVSPGFQTIFLPLHPPISASNQAGSPVWRTPIAQRLLKWWDLAEIQGADQDIQNGLA